ncbi:MAG: hypothetical protein ABEI86_09015, partial [Halobacteriaceae archaeon]
DLLVLLKDDEIVETSPLSTLEDSLLLVNSDLYKTGTKQIEDTDLPDVVTNLSDTIFTLRGYPEADVEKLVLTLVSRYIEYQAWRHQTGTLRTGFQRLSRLTDERGTQEVYERLGGIDDLDLAVYGVP